MRLKLMTFRLGRRMIRPFRPGNTTFYMVMNYFSVRKGKIRAVKCTDAMIISSLSIINTVKC